MLIVKAFCPKLRLLLTTVLCQRTTIFLYIRNNAKNNYNFLIHPIKEWWFSKKSNNLVGLTFDILLILLQNSLVGVNQAVKLTIDPD